MRITKVLNWLLYTIALIAAILLFITFEGTFSIARAMHRSVLDWGFFWLPSLFDYILLILTVILSIKKIRFGLLVAFCYAIKDFWFFFDIVFGGENVFIVPNIQSYIGASLHYLLFFISIIGILLWIIEFFRKLNDLKSTKG